MASKYYNMEKVKPVGLELKERLVGIQRVTKVTKGTRGSLVFFLSKNSGLNKKNI